MLPAQDVYNYFSSENALICYPNVYPPAVIFTPRIVRFDIAFGYFCHEYRFVVHAIFCERNGDWRTAVCACRALEHVLVFLFVLHAFDLSIIGNAHQQTPALVVGKCDQGFGNFLKTADLVLEIELFAFAFLDK